MKMLTKEQADLLRSIRKQAGFAGSTISILKNKLSVPKCPHEPEVETDPENCPVCSLFGKLTDAGEMVDEFNRELDAHLVRGPEVAT